MNKNTILSGILLSITFLASAMEKSSSDKEEVNSGSSDIYYAHNTFRNIVITPDNLYELSVKIPTHLQQDLQKALTIPENRKFVEALLEFKPCSDTQEFLANEKAIKDYIQSKNIDNKSIWNYLFCLPNSNAMIRIAGPRNRLATKRATVYNIPRPLTEEKLKQKNATWIEATSAPNATFQHTSCAAVYLRLSELLPYLKHVKIIPTYLYALTNEPQTPCSDTKYLTIQEKYQSNVIFELKQLDEAQKKKIINDLPELAFKELFCAIHVGPLWNLGVDTNLMVEKDKHNQLLIGDLEQPNDTNGNFFFYQGEEGLETYKFHANTGLNVMQESLDHYAPEKAAFWKELRKQDWRTVLKELKQ